MTSPTRQPFARISLARQWFTPEVARRTAREAISVGQNSGLGQKRTDHHLRMIRVPHSGRAAIGAA
jgi:hypothetical protein